MTDQPQERRTQQLQRGEAVACWVDCSADADAIVAASLAYHQVVIDYVGRSAPSDAALRSPRALTHLALRTVLARVSDDPDCALCPFMTSETGKPHLADSGVQFSVAHTTRFALVAVSNGAAVGVDVEAADREVGFPPGKLVRLRDAARSFPGQLAIQTDRSRGWNSGENNIENLGFAVDGALSDLRNWTLLEALGKSDGRGVFALMGDLGILGRTRGEARSGWPVGLQSHRVVTHINPAGFVATIAAPGGTDLRPLMSIRAWL